MKTSRVSAECSRQESLPTAVRGVLTGVIEEGEPLVDFSSNPVGCPLVASAAVPVQESDLGREAILLFEDGDVQRPILLALLHHPQNKCNSVDLTIDGKRLVLSAEKELVLRCGDASITLTKTGKLILKGAYLLSRSSGPNRIQGASVQVN